MSNLFFGSMVDALAELTGTEVTATATGYILKGAGSVKQISFSSGAEILRAGGAKYIEVVNPAIKSIGYGGTNVVDELLFIKNAPAGQQVAAKVLNLSPNMQAALSNGGAQVGSTALSPITKMEVVQSTGTNTLKVTSKGILTKIPLKAAMRACAVAQGVVLGVNIVETNPELCTKISNRIFGTNIDPSEIANIIENTTVWANIKDGAVFITEDIVDAIKSVFLEEGVYQQGQQDNGIYTDPSLSSGSLNTSLDYVATGAYTPYAYIVAKCSTTDIVIPNDLVGKRKILVVNKKMRLTGSGINYSFNVFLAFNHRSTSQLSLKIGRSGYRDVGTTVPTSPAPVPVDQIINARVTTAGNTLYTIGGLNSGGGDNRFRSPVITDTYSVNYNIDGISAVLYLPDSDAFESAVDSYFNTGSSPYEVTPGSSDVEGTTKIPGAVYPTIGGSTATDYPDWWSRKTETIDGVDDSDNYTDVNWLPIDIFQPTGNDPSEYSQTQAQDGTLEDDEQINSAISGIDESIESDPDNDPFSDPSPQVYPNPNPEPNPQTDFEPFTPSPPVVDTSDGDAPDPTIATLTTAITSGLAYVYNPTIQETRQLGRVLWTRDVIENLKKIFVDPMDGIIGFLIIYATPKTTSPEDIVLGFYNTGIQSKVVSNQYITIDCGNVTINEHFKDARDYSPYTSVSLYLPFIGVVSLFADDIINSHVNITYHVDVLTGTCLATVKIFKIGASAVVYQYPGNCGVQLPLSSGNYANVITSLFSVGISAVGGAALGAAKAVGRRAAGAVYGGMRSAAINAHSSQLEVQQSGCIGSNAGAMGIRKPYFIIRRPVTSDAYAYNMQYGYPANKWVMLGSMKGFTRVRSVHLENIKCTDEEKQMIESALKEGVIF